MSEPSENNSKSRDKLEAEERLSAIFRQATDPDRHLAEKLLLQRRTTFGIAMICLSPFVVSVAILFHEEHPGATPIVLLMAMSLLVAGSIHIERVNIARRNLAKKILMRLRKVG